MCIKYNLKKVQSMSTYIVLVLVATVFIKQLIYIKSLIISTKKQYRICAIEESFSNFVEKNCIYGVESAEQILRLPIVLN